MAEGLKHFFFCYPDSCFFLICYTYARVIKTLVYVFLVLEEKFEEVAPCVVYFG